MQKFCLVLLIAAGLILAACGCDGSRQAGAAETDSKAILHDKLSHIVKESCINAGVAVICDGDSIELNNDSYPLMSVFKFHIAVAILRQGLPVDSVVHVRASSLRPHTYSPMRESIGVRDFDMTVDSLLYYSVCKSDNNACDILIDFAGGIEKVDSIIGSLGIGETSLTQTEESMHALPDNCYRNYTSPLALSSLIHRLYDGKLLDDKSTGYLKTLLRKSTTGRDKIMAAIPAEHFIGHKSGLSDRTDNNLLIASGDVATFSTKSGKNVFLAILVKNTTAPDSSVNRLFVDIANCIYQE